MPQPASVREGVPGGNTCVRTGARGAFSGGNWMVTTRPPGAPGRCRRGRALVRPFQLNSLHPGDPSPSGGRGEPLDLAGSNPLPSRASPGDATDVDPRG